MLIEQLLGKGSEIKRYGQHVAIARLTGASKTYINRTIPHIVSVMVGSLDVLVKERDVIVIGNRDDEFSEFLPE